MGGSVGVCGAAFLPWVASGATTRNSFSTVRAARTLDIVDSSVGSALLASWYFVPMLAALVVLLTLFGRRRTVAAISGVLGLVAFAFAVLVVRSPVISLIGAQLSIGMGLIAFIGAIGLMIDGSGRQSVSEVEDLTAGLGQEARAPDKLPPSAD